MDRLQRLIKVPDAFIERLSPIQEQIFKKLLAKLAALKQVNGMIVPSLENLKVIDSIREFIHDELIKSDYSSAVRDYAKEFDKQAGLNAAYYTKQFNSEFSTVLADAAVKQTKKAVVQALITDSVQVNFLTPLENTLSVAVQSGAGFSDTISAIRDFVEGNSDVDGAILKYSKQIAHDAFANADRAYNSAVSDELEVEWFLWAGGQIDTSRCFCIERHGKYYHYKEIEAWGRGENIGACETNSGEWAGRNRSTNEQTIFTYAGGYGCLHTVAGVSIFSVPKEDVLRNVQNGNYRPTQTESDFFGF